MSRKHGGHHGGSWKVAYADFITAMMALFLVLWLTAQDTKIKEAVERSFQNPWASLTKEAPGIIPNKEIPVMPAKGLTAHMASPIELKWLRRLHQDLMKQLQTEENRDKTVELELLPEGLRISIYDRGGKPIFEQGSPKFTEYGNWVFSTLAWQIKLYESFLIELEGHTERGLPPASPDYGNWELSADRANAARRKLVQHAVREIQIRKVAGYADTMPLKDQPPEAEINRRVTVMLKLRDDNSP